jgi:hypothetical protein
VVMRCPKGVLKVQGGFIIASVTMSRVVKDLGDTGDNQMLGSAYWLRALSSARVPHSVPPKLMIRIRLTAALW